MSNINFKYFLLIAAFMLAVKPFVGFSLANQLSRTPKSHIVVKAFTKRKQEYVDGSSYDVNTIVKRLADPAFSARLLYTFFLSLLFPLLFGRLVSATKQNILSIRLGLLPPKRRYLLSGSILI